MNILILILGTIIQTVTVYRSSLFFKKKLSQGQIITFGMILVESLINTVVSFLLMLLTLWQTIMLCEIGGGEYCSNGVLFIVYLIPVSIIWGILSTFISKLLTMRNIQLRNTGLIFSLLFLVVTIFTSGLFYSVLQNEKIKAKELEKYKALLSPEYAVICSIQLSQIKPHQLQVVTGYKVENGILNYYQSGFGSRIEEAGILSSDGKITLNKNFDFLMNGGASWCTNSRGKTLSQLYELTLTK